MRLGVGDIDSACERVHIRDAKDNKNRLAPLPETTPVLLRRFWQVPARYFLLTFPQMCR